MCELCKRCGQRSVGMEQCSLVALYRPLTTSTFLFAFLLSVCCTQLRFGDYNQCETKYSSEHFRREQIDYGPGLPKICQCGIYIYTKYNKLLRVI